MLESLFSKVAGPQACNFIKKRLQLRCFSVKFSKFLRILCLKNIQKRLVLFLLKRLQGSIKVYSNDLLQVNVPDYWPFRPNHIEISQEWDE